MLSARHLQQAAARQCSRQLTATVTTTGQFRALATTSQLRQQQPEPFLTPQWVDNGNHLRDSSTSQSYQTIFDASTVHSNPRNPRENTAPATPEQHWAAWETSHVAQLKRPNNAYSGRSVAVSALGLGSALDQLKRILSVNSVRYSHVRDERHEKKGEKRNRLKSARWRKRFAHEVRKRVQLVNEIRARGA